MARLEKDIYSTIPADSLKNPVVFVVDMVNGFCKEGDLHDKAILDIVDAQKELMDALECRNVFVCDNHPPRTREFESYPKHCVIGTSEAQVIEELQPYIKRHIPKNSTNTFHAQGFQEFLKEEMDRYNDIVVVGCCTDLCILQFVLSLQSYLNEHNMVNHSIVVPVDCVETYHIEGVHDAALWNKMALENMRINGVNVVSHIK
ncbi:MAG: isochorismatase family cysteine hydrolase [Bacillota bacterium]|nr:isochorismatase family cysteine hydrolase [Bacillota bacterium]